MVKTTTTEAASDKSDDDDDDHRQKKLITIPPFVKSTPRYGPVTYPFPPFDLVAGPVAGPDVGPVGPVG